MTVSGRVPRFVALELRPRGRQRRWTIAVLVLALVGASTTSVVLAADHVSTSERPPYVLAWSDEFNGAAGSAPNPATWKAVEGGDGWGNGELECYTNSRYNSALDGEGDLVISALRAPQTHCAGGSVNDYTSARLTTIDRREFQYGRIEVRAKMPTGVGVWPAIWAEGANYSTAGWPFCGEMDISEVVGKAPDQTRSSVHGPSASGGRVDITKTHDLPTNLADGFHVYAVDWERNRISYSVDGVTFLVVTPRVGQPWPYNQPFFLLLNVAVGGTLPGAPTYASTWPQRMFVDYVRVYQRPYADR